MTITATVNQTTGSPGQAGTQLGTASLAEPASWTRLTALNDVTPTGGARLRISSDAAQFRYLVMPPRSAQRTNAPDELPPNSGRLCNTVGYVYVDDVPFGAQIWVKQA